MDSVLLRIKLHTPPVRPEYVLRPRLIEILKDGLQRKLTLLSAPAGFGKSTLLAGWILQNEVRAGWLSLDDGDNDLVCFLSYLVSAINSVNPDVGNGALDMLDVAQFRSPRPVLTNLINDLSHMEEHFALVLDDYHYIRSRAVHDVMGYLFEHQPACLHFYIATRTDPPFTLALLRGRGEMVELRAKDLRFNRQESISFIQLSTGINMNEADADTITRLTDGWITGIQMAALSIKDVSDLGAFFRDFSGSNRYILDYLMEEVLDRQSEQTLNFLLRTCILDRMSGKLCDALLLNDSEGHAPSIFNPRDGSQILVDLERQNLFIIPLDEKRQWYRYHPLFADLLQQRLRTIQPALVSQLHKRAAAWYRTHKMIPEAIRHSLAGEDFNNAIDMITAIAENAMLRSEFAMVKSWMDCLPDHILVDYPLLQIYHLYTSIFSGLPANEAVQRIDKIHEIDRENKFEGDILAIQCMMAAHQQNIPLSAKLGEQALKILPEDRIFFRSAITGFLGFAYLVQGNTDAARRILEESARVSRQADNLTMLALAMCHLAEIALIEARISDAEANYRHVFKIGLNNEGKPRPVLGIAFIGLGMVQREKGQLNEAFANLKRGVDLVQKWTPTGAIQGYISMAQIYQLRGDEISANTAFETAKELALKFGTMQEDDKIVLCHQAKLLIAQNKPIEALRLFSIDTDISEGDLDHLFPPLNPDTLHTFLELVFYLVVAEIFFALEKFIIAERLFTRAFAVTHTKGWKRMDLTIMTYQAEIYARLGRRKQALQILDQVLKCTARGEILIDFLERNHLMVELLQEALHAGIETKFVTRILIQMSALITGGEPYARTEKSKLLLVEPLTEREFEVLGLIAAGLTNAEIASRLVLAENTVKKHVSNVLGKLGVTNRNEAAKLGREIGLL